MKIAKTVSISGLALAFLTMMAAPVTTLALQPQNPTTLCDRFMAGPERTQCEKRMKDQAPDWYLASVCSKQFDDKAFYECVDLSKTTAFSPKKLEACDSEGFSDQSRLDCIKGTKVSRAEEVFQTETPKKRVAPKGSQRLSEGY